MLGSALFGKGSRSYAKMMEVGLFAGEVKGPAPVPVPGSPDTYFRASSLGKGCPRAEGIKIINGLAEDAVIEPKLAMLFAKGHAYHHMHQDILVPSAFPPEAILGWWRQDDGILSESYANGSPKLWSMEEASVDQEGPPSYEEVHVYDHEYCLKGHPDMILDWGKVPAVADNHEEVIEFKTRNGTDFMWDKVDAESGGSPLPEHILQVQAYMMMTGIPRARIIYLRKGDREWAQGLSSSMSEHIVFADPKIQDAIRTFLSDWRASIAAAYEHKVLAPKKSKCMDISKAPAKWCGCRYRCFGKSSTKDPMVPILENSE